MLIRFLAVVILLVPSLVFAEDFVAGKDYELINANAPASKTKVVPVTEFFSYGCPWCARIDGTLMGWVKQQGNKIEFARVPVVFNKDWTFYAKAYYAAKLLGIQDKVTPLLFKLIQDPTAKKMNSDQAMIDFFTAQGVDAATAKSAFESSTMVEMQVNEGMTLMSRDHVNGVPAVVINQQYKTDLQMAQSEERFLKILDFLVAKAGK